jgi:hypothetical protein
LQVCGATNPQAAAKGSVRNYLLENMVLSPLSDLVIGLW